jgi:hypothetical protein
MTLSKKTKDIPEGLLKIFALWRLLYPGTNWNSMDFRTFSDASGSIQMLANFIDSAVSVQLE